jgi:hypothetical protein
VAGGVLGLNGEDLVAAVLVDIESAGTFGEYRGGDEVKGTIGSDDVWGIFLDGGRGILRSLRIKRNG